MSFKQVENELIDQAIGVGITKTILKSIFGSKKKKTLTDKPLIKPVKKPKRYNRPTIDLLDHYSELSNNAVDLSTNVQQILSDHKVKGIVVNKIVGPRLTTYAVKLEAGVNPNVISRISDSLKVNLMVDSIRIVTPIPNTPHIGIEVPNGNTGSVKFASTIGKMPTHMNIPLNLGNKTSGEAMYMDLSDSPHLLIAGATGSGKSVCMHSILMSLLYRYSPKEMQLVMIDPKRVEFYAYNNVPHLITPVITEAETATQMLKWITDEMEIRYKIMQEAKCRTISSFNKTSGKHMPYMVVVIDELADLMMTSDKEVVEKSIARIAQLARAVGIHLVVATQRPSTNVITGLIKANFPTRIAFQVASGVDSRVILDQNGAQDLLGKGDMLIKTSSKIERVQGCFISDEEIERVVKHII